MSQNAYIKLVPASSKQAITINDVKELFFYYKDMTNKTSQQINWEFNEATFPYEIMEGDQAENWLCLKSNDTRYNRIIIGVDKETIPNPENNETTDQTYIQITLPESATHGDKGKANEFCKFISKKLQGELHLFNGRVMYFYKR